MPRKDRPTAAGIYHVSTQAQRDEELFRDDADFLRFESEVRLLVESGVRTCIAACVLTTQADGTVHQQVRTFSTMTASLALLSAWLTEQQVEQQDESAQDR